jgi:hypothetical protein
VGEQIPRCEFRNPCVEIGADFQQGVLAISPLIAISTHSTQIRIGLHSMLLRRRYVHTCKELQINMV